MLSWQQWHSHTLAVPLRIDLHVGIDGNSGNGISCNGSPLLNNTQQRGQIPLSANGELISIGRGLVMVYSYQIIVQSNDQ